MILTDKATKTKRLEINAQRGMRDMQPGWVRKDADGVETFYPDTHWQEVSPEIWDEVTTSCWWDETTGLWMYQPKVREGMPRPPAVPALLTNKLRQRMKRYPEGHVAIVVEKQR